MVMMDLHIFSDDNSDEESNGDEQVDNKTNKRKRKSAPDNWKRNIRKKNRSQGKSYTTVKGKQIASKEFEAYECLCPLKCSTNVPTSDRKSCFDTYYSCGNWDLQTAYINGHVKSYDVKRRYGAGSPSKSRRQCSRYYYLDCNRQSKRVCKNMFMQTLCVDTARIHRALVKAASGRITDNRGRHTAWNKTPVDDMERVKEHIQSFPKYKSHYCRKDTEREYLSPTLNLAKMFNLYQEKCDQENTSHVGQSTYEKTFYNEFNLYFKTPEKDTCKTCDLLQTQIQSEEQKPEAQRDRQKLEKLQKEKETHLKRSSKAREILNSDKLKPQEEQSKTHVTVTFDLQKTLPVPRIPTGLAYYKRQLAVYNLGIHAYMSKGETAYMCMWHEGIASRGAQEVSSCIKCFVENKLPVGTTSISAWSDSCGGQNRNIKVCSMWLHLLAVTDIEYIDHNFLESGHSYLPNDSDFGDIERAAKYHPNVYIPDEWCTIVKDARAKHRFEVIQMNKEQFIATSNLEAALVNRKKTIDGEKVEWLRMKHIHFEKKKPLKMFFKYSHSNDEEYKVVDMAHKRRSKDPRNIDEEPVALYPNGRGISKEKMMDLKSLLPFVPPIHHRFYKSLRVDGTVQTDDLCGNAIDYELE